MATVTKTLPIPGSKSQPLKSTRASITFDPANPSSARTLTITSVTKNRRGRTTASTDTTYTQGADGMFRDTSGTLWAGEYDGGGGKVRNTMGKAINSANVKDSTVDEWGANATGLKKKEGDGGSGADGKDKGSTITNSTPRKKNPISSRRMSYGDLRYPITAMKETDFMKITMYRYVPGDFGRNGPANERITDSLGTCILPIPPGLVDANSVAWGDHKMNAIQMKAAEFATGVMNADEPFKKVAESAGKMIESAQKNPQAKELMQTYLLSQVGAIGASQDQLLARGSGKVLNPNLELLFGGPALRSFSYTFRLTARSEKESIMIQRIIRFFKQGMSVKGSAGGGMYLSSPNVFHVQFKDSSGRDHKFINKLKKTACTGFNVNYVPDGTYMTFANTAMTAYEIGMSFQELEPIFDSDYKYDDEIGY